jgi:hypothetical protein
MVVRAKLMVCKYGLAQGQSRQTKSKKENRYVIEVMRLNKERGEVPLVRKNENERMHRAFSLAVK